MSPSEATISMDLAEQTRKILATLTPREEKVLRMRFGISERADYSPEELRDSLEMSRERAKADRIRRRSEIAKSVPASNPQTVGQIKY